MPDATNTVTIRGKVNFFKMLPDQLGLNYSKDGKEWKTDFYDFPIKEIKALGIGDRVKEKEGYLDGQPYMTFKQSEIRRDGAPNKPVPVKDILGNDWNEADKLGNGSTVDVKFAVVDYGKGKKKGVYIRSVRVLDRVEYAGKQDFDPINETDEFFAAAQAAEAASKNKIGKTILEALDEENDPPFEVDNLDDDELPI